MTTVWYCMVCGQIVRRYDRPQGGRRELWCLCCRQMRVFTSNRLEAGTVA